MARVESDIVVDAPLRAVYNQWTQFESYPLFMHGVSRVTQLDDRHLRWRASIGGREKEWDAEIQEQVPDERIIWRSTDGAPNAGIVRFREVEGDRTEVHLEMSYEPEGLVENVGDALGVPERQIRDDLERFRAFIEARGRESGGWRGVIEHSDAPAGQVGDARAASPARAVTQAGGRNISRDRIEEGASAAGQALPEQERQIAEAAGLPVSEVRASPRTTPGYSSEAAIANDYAREPLSSQDGVRWRADAWDQLTQAALIRWPGLPSDALDNVDPDRASLARAVAEHVAIPRDELDREIDLLVRT
ncbi:MAG: SRPBCC family protein [Dehalococcoidia bacterium]|nr:SRPBCC family protein [Dehalococcoidia bacterium]